MATYGEEPVDNYFYSSYNPFMGRYPRPRDPGWKYKSYLSHYGDNSDAFNNQQRAQLKSILSQINPKLTPRLRRANTKDVAVQVNPKRDAWVQCSLGPRLLQGPKTPRRRRPEPAPPGGVRYPRTLAVYSPVTYRSITSFFVDENNNQEQYGDQKVSSDSPKPAEPPGEKAGDSDGRSEGEDPAGEDGTSTKTSDRSKKARSKLKPEVTEEATQVMDAAAQAQLQPEEAKGKARVRFQFLEQKYGYYHCRTCNLRWESAYVWCVQGTNKVYFKQFCRKCQKDFNPYRVEDITCHTCNKARCSCAITQRHVDPKRPHRQDLCGRCKGKRLSCDSTFSFKYII
ncbi:zygote arrest protein 1 [Cololabis saira]|uniref:zygote arrest protein 1 n=1 Tax=Cololabis saira TaxID=129043 RepID=UPI002AD44E5F|nr:zygote arrest protein 1 [Cololabis saira]